MKKIIISFFCLVCSLLDAKTNPWPPNYNSHFDFLFIQSPVFVDNYPFDADGILIIAQTRFRFAGIIPNINFYGASCNIYNQTGDTATKHYIGNVSLNDSTLFYLNDSTYKSYGMDLSQDTSFTWKLGGTITGFIAPVNQFTTTKPLININNFNLDIIDTNLYRGNGFTYSHPSIQADSIIYIMGSDTQRVQKKITGSSSGINFTSADLLVLSQSNSGSFTIAIYNTMSVFLNGKKYYFQNNSLAIVSILHVF